MIAFIYHFPPSELWALELDELEFWEKRAQAVANAMKPT